MSISEDSLEKDIDECKRVLEDFLLTSELLPICSRSLIADIDSFVADYLVKKDYDRFLANDISYGPQVGGISEGVLCAFVREERVFEGKKGKFKLKETYGPMSVRSFQAWLV